MNGVIRIEFIIENGQVKIMLNAPLETPADRDLTVKILAGAIPIAVNYQPTVIKPLNGAPVISKLH